MKFQKFQKLIKVIKQRERGIKRFESYGGFWRRWASYTLDNWPTDLAGIIFIIQSDHIDVKLDY